MNSFHHIQQQYSLPVGRVGTTWCSGDPDRSYDKKKEVKVGGIEENRGEKSYERSQGGWKMRK